MCSRDNTDRKGRYRYESCRLVHKTFADSTETIFVIQDFVLNRIEDSERQGRRLQWRNGASWHSAVNTKPGLWELLNKLNEKDTWVKQVKQLHMYMLQTEKMSDSFRDETKTRRPAIVSWGLIKSWCDWWILDSRVSPGYLDTLWNIYVMIVDTFPSPIVSATFAFVPLIT